MINVIIMYNNTWNVMLNKETCLHYGSIESIEKWIIDNKLTHKAYWSDFEKCH